MTTVIAEKRKTLLGIVAGTLVLAIACSVAVGFLFGKYYNLSNTFGYRDVTEQLVSSLADNTTDLAEISVFPLSAANISYLVVSQIYLKLNLNASMDSGIVVLGRRNWPPTLDAYDAINVGYSNIHVNPLNKSSTLRSCHGELLFLGFFANETALVGKNTTLHIITDIAAEEECVGTGFTGLAAGVLLASFGATALLISIVIAAVIAWDRAKNPGAALGYRTLGAH